ncbi:endolysin [Streptomyces phage BRock]|uniref:Endolysin n=1 Tax=Streptomyces phage BRock TaxID=1913591 RepID=A0A1J0GVV1_9CAUD|nr:endolysin [Streptomyces phage BRock]APC46302.1 endolysin [Streptomyces phage BRock]
MVATGPQRYPGSSSAYWYEGRYPGDRQEVNVVVLHTTEGTSLPSYEGGISAPNFTAVPDFKNKKLVWYQHFYVDTSSRALVNKRGGVDTNTNNVCQVELVGTCDPKAHSKWDREHIFWPEAPEWALQEVAKFLAWMNVNHNVPLSGPKVWRAYPDSYGVNDSRLTFAEWDAFKGICGHQHVPENDHGDPGNIDFSKLLELAKAIVTPPKPVEPKPTTPSKPAQPTYEPYPGKAFFVDGKKSPIIAAMHKRLVAVKCNAYKSSRNTDVWGSGDEASYKLWQKKQGFSGSDADGIPGKQTWDALKVPNVPNK